MRVAILTGREKGKERRDILARLEAGEIDLLVGTHALIQDDVVYKALALAVVDEQHRFGVRERLALTSKGEAVDVLVLSATPIPRTLVLTYFGDMDVSELREKPAGRQPIDTRTVPLSRLEEVMDGVGRALKAGKRVYWICPLVEESEAEGTEHLTNATKRFESLQKRFGDAVGLVHGQMKGTDKDRVMAQFAAGEIGLLVATTVVEVGVDVPAASIMVIENAERFGLAQLHQLRGRIGRGSEASTCLLLYKEPLDDMSKARLQRDPRDHRRFPDRRGGPEAARRRRRARHAPERPARLPHRAVRRAWPTHYAGARRGAADHEGEPEAHRRARRGVALSAVFVRA